MGAVISTPTVDLLFKTKSEQILSPPINQPILTVMMTVTNLATVIILITITIIMMMPVIRIIKMTLMMIIMTWKVQF